MSKADAELAKLGFNAKEAFLAGTGLSGGYQFAAAAIATAVREE